MSRIKSSFGGTIEDRLKSLRKELAWVRQLHKHRRPLGSIAHIVRLASLWDYGHESDGRPKLYLAYIGKARNEDEAKPDLIKIMRALHCIFDHPRVTSGGDSRPRAYYEAPGSLRDLKVMVELDVPWLPKGCEVRVERHRTWSTRSHHSVTCRR